MNLLKFLGKENICSSSKTWDVKILAPSIAQKMVIDNHYLHRKSSNIISYGFYSDNILLGTCIFGKPASPHLCKGICGEDEKNHVIELNRLWIDDVVGKNAESWFISRCLHKLKEDKPEYDIVVSYADTSVNHVGIIYQACSFIYTGLSDKHVEWRIVGADEHSRHKFDEYGGVKKAKEILGDKMVYAERPRKHRYIWFNGNRRRNYELKNKLKYKIMEYPSSHEKHSCENNQPSVSSSTE